jgi:phage/plasmid-like protein (TIGR03299 family)
MSALVESMFSVRKPPWHNENVTILDEYPGSWAEARVPAGLEWEPVEEPVYRLKGVEASSIPVYELYGMDENNEPIYKLRGTEVTETRVYESNPGYKHIVRSDTGKILSVNTDGYTLITHEEMGEIVEAVLGITNVKYETAGCLDGGKAVWVLVSLDEPIELPGDSSVTYPFMAITNRHDGKGSCSLRATAIRIVCMNTLRAAELEGERTGATFSFRHSRKWRERIDEAKQAITGVRDEMVAYQALAKELLLVPVTMGQRELFITEFIPMPPQGLITDRVAGNVEASRTGLRRIFESATTAEIADTAYGLLQASVEYADHVRTARTWETKLNRSLMRPEPLKQRAYKLISEITDARISEYV